MGGGGVDSCQGVVWGTRGGYYLIVCFFLVLFDVLSLGLSCPNRHHIFTMKHYCIMSYMTTVCI